MNAVVDHHAPFAIPSVLPRRLEKAAAVVRQEPDGSIELLAQAERDVARLRHIRVGVASSHSEAALLASASLGLRMPQYHVLITCSGYLDVEHARTNRRLNPGAIIGVSNSTPLTIRSEGEAEFVFITFPLWWAWPEIIGDNNRASEHFIAADFFSAEAIRQLAMRLLSEESDNPAASLRIVAGMLKTSFEHFAKLADRSKVVLGGRIGAVAISVCRNVANETYSIGEVASELKCSVRSIQKLCSDNGTTFNRLLMHTRLSQAAYLLTHTGERISEIAFSSGFVSFSHFCRCFKSRYGISAKSFRSRGANYYSIDEISEFIAQD